MMENCHCNPNLEEVALLLQALLGREGAGQRLTEVAEGMACMIPWSATGL